MSAEGLFFAIVLTLGLTPLLIGGRRRRSGAFTLALIASIGIASLACAWTLLRARTPIVSEAAIDYRPVQGQRDGYVGSGTCRSCHPHEFDTWHGSFHRTMTQVVGPETVAGDFDDVDLQYMGQSFRLERRGDEFWIVQFGGTAPISRRIVLSTGSHHLQVYWCTTDESGRLAAMPFVYLIAERQWIPLNASFVTPPSRVFSEDQSRWAETCLACHTTHGVPGLQVPSTVFDPEVSEFGIACEACHGPAREHVRANRDPRRRYRLHLESADDPTVVHPGHLSPLRSSQVCGQCHAVSHFRSDLDEVRYLQSGPRYRPGEDLNATKLVLRLEELPQNPRLEKIHGNPEWWRGAYWSDGMIRVTGREYNGLIESPCFRHGDETRGILSCLDCHRMHRDVKDPRTPVAWADDQLEPGMRGNAACLGCHQEYVDRESLRRHTHHEEDSTGSECYNCHMPYTSYGLLKAIRSHQIDSPTVQASLATGRPNACNQCHLDRTLAWTADYLERWYETPPPELTDEEQRIAASVLWLLRGDAGQRALMAWSLGWEPAESISGREWMPLYLAQLLDDPYEAVRLIAFRSLSTKPGYENLRYAFTGPRAERFVAAREAIAIFRRRYTEVENAKTGEAILIGPDGTVRSQVITRLGQQRDDTPLTLQE